MAELVNRTFDEISVGDQAHYSKTLSADDIALFAAVSGDINPVHLDAGYAATTMFGERIAHGAWTGAVVSAALALELPGPGTIYLSQTLQFRAPVKIGDTVTVKLEVTAKHDSKPYVTLACEAVNQHGKTVARGVAEVMAPTERIRCPAPALPPIRVG